LCPGKKDRHSWTGEWDRDLDIDLESIQQWGAATVVTLIEHHEFELLNVAGLGRAIRERGMLWYHLPIRDVSIPSADFEDQWKAITPQLREQLFSGQSILIHCRGGLGRAGTIAACLLVDFGLTAENAMAAVREARTGAIETEEQRHYVLKYERFAAV